MVEEERKLSKNNPESHFNNLYIAGKQNETESKIGRILRSLYRISTDLFRTFYILKSWF